MQLALVSSARALAQARATVRSAFDVTPRCAVHVLDLDGSYVALRDEHVVSPQDIGLDPHDFHVHAMLLEPHDLVRWVLPALMRWALRSGPTVIAASAGVLLLHDPTELVEIAAQARVALVGRSAEMLPADGAWPGPADLLAAGSYSPHLVAVGRDATEFLDLWERLATDPSTASDRWLDAGAGHLRQHTVDTARFLVSAWTCPTSRIGESAAGSLTVDGAPAVALDLTGLDPDAPWLLDVRGHGLPRVLLSDHPALARLAERFAAEVRNAGTDVSRPAAYSVTSLGVSVHPHLRALFRSALDVGSAASIEALPDPFDPIHADELAAWLVEPAKDGRDLGLGRYLAAVYRTRPDLQAAYPGVPGEHVGAFLTWADDYGRHETGYSSEMIDRALSAVGGIPPLPAPDAPVLDLRAGVNVVGYLRGELGVGESARLMLGAMVAGGIAHSTASVDRHLQSRQGAPFAATAADALFDTTLMCVNANMTAGVAASVPSLLERSYRIGMWYWEVEDFPVSQHAGFGHVDEVWVATDFVRQAVEPHSPVPVRTITPPLPQPRPTPGRTRADLGLPERPFFLFSFDFLSTVERKNPWGLVDAFEAAFSPGEGPVLVIKSINANRRPDQAERLRLRVAGSPDILLLEDYLDAQDRDALVALCDCYVSLHRSEGLGLTMAEAMALGKPVIATGYSGNLQFMTETNSFLVPWTPAIIPTGCEPYSPGGTWADPDLEAAAGLMRAVREDPEAAAARGRRAADDLRTRHSPQAAGRVVAARLAEIDATRRAQQRLGPRDHVRALARRVRHS